MIRSTLGVTKTTPLAPRGMVVAEHPRGAEVGARVQAIANMADGGGSLQGAVEAPRVHTEGGDVLVSTRAGEAALAGLARRGHTVVAKEETYSTLNFARPVAIRVTPRGLEAGVEQFGMAWAAGH
jgi:gamma-glutamyltranspeptidase